MAEMLTFELVTPESLAFSAEVEMVEVPGEMGDFGVLAGHAPFLSMVRAGVVTVHLTETTHKRYFVANGYAQVNPLGCVVLTEHVRDLETLDTQTVMEELEKARLDVENASEGDAKTLAEGRYDVALALKEAMTTH